MDYYRKETGKIAIICYSIILFFYVVLRVNAFAPAGTVLSEVIIGLSLIGMVFSFLFFIGFSWEFGKESITFHHISSIWTWLMQFPSFQRAFVTGEYVGFRRLCVFIIGTCIMLYVIPDFHQEGLMILPALTMGSAVVFIIHGFILQKEGQHVAN